MQRAVLLFTIVALGGVTPLRAASDPLATDSRGNRIGSRAPAQRSHPLRVPGGDGPVTRTAQLPPTARARSPQSASVPAGPRRPGEVSVYDDRASVFDDQRFQQQPPSAAGEPPPVYSEDVTPPDFSSGPDRTTTAAVAPAALAEPAAESNGRGVVYVAQQTERHTGQSQMRGEARGPRGRPQSSADVPLAPRSEMGRITERGATAEPDAKSPEGWSSVVTVMASLGLVLGLFVAWVMRRGAPGVVPLLPKAAIEVLGRMPMPGRQQMQLLRVGNKLLLVHLSLTGAETLTEITEPEEVDRLAGLCQQSHAKSASKDFQDVLDELGRERRGGDFLNQEAFGVEFAGKRPKRRGFAIRRGRDD